MLIAACSIDGRPLYFCTAASHVCVHTATRKSLQSYAVAFAFAAHRQRLLPSPGHGKHRLRLLRPPSSTWLGAAGEAVVGARMDRACKCYETQSADRCARIPRVVPV